MEGTREQMKEFATNGLIQIGTDAGFTEAQVRFLLCLMYGVLDYTNQKLMGIEEPQAEGDEQERFDTAIPT
jgi:hypothetical protein